jgi:hypothetical protein
VPVAGSYPMISIPLLNQEEAAVEPLVVVAGGESAGLFGLRPELADGSPASDEATQNGEIGEDFVGRHLWPSSSRVYGCTE